VRRGEIWTAALAGPYTQKPRPTLILQADLYDQTNSITVYGLTTVFDNTPLTRPLFHPTAANGLERPSRVMIDKITTVPRSRLRERIGSATAQEMLDVASALALFLAIPS
jgi:mRNA interferase MazF